MSSPQVGRFKFLKTLTLPPEWESTVNPLLSPPPGGLIFFKHFWGGGGLNGEGGLFNLAKRITFSKNTVVWDRVDLRVVQLQSVSKVFNSLVEA